MTDFPTDEQIAATEAQIAQQAKRIEFYLTEYTVEILANKMHSGDLVIPEYQREFTWDHPRKSRFIESVLMGLPIPFLFFWEQPDGRLEIIDGSQRLRTLEEFLLGDLQLGKLETLTQLTGFRFRNLTPARRRKIGNRSIRGVVLNEDADEKARLDMFERINTGSLNANPAEIRRGSLRGPFVNLVLELADSPLLAELAPMAKKRVDEREREELVARFFAYGDGLSGYRDRPSDFIYDYTKAANARFAKDPQLADSYRRSFDETMRFVQANFPFGFARSPKGNATPRTRFEAIAIGSKLALEAEPDLVAPDPAIWLNDDAFKKVIGSDGANAIARLRERIDFVKRRLLGELDDPSA